MIGQVVLVEHHVTGPETLANPLDGLLAPADPHELARGRLSGIFWHGIV